MASFVPIMVATIMFNTVYAQMTTVFVEQVRPGCARCKPVNTLVHMCKCCIAALQETLEGWHISKGSLHACCSSMHAFDGVVLGHSRLTSLCLHCAGDDNGPAHGKTDYCFCITGEA